MNVRAVAALVLAGAVVAAVIALSRPTAEEPGAHVVPPPQGTPEPARGTAGPPHQGDGPLGPGRQIPFQSASECRSCHQDVYDEWKGSYHGMAWTDPMVQKLSGGFQQPECIDCHAPLPIHVTGVKDRVAPRRHSREDGVDCLTCHLMEDGVSVAATRSVDTSATPDACRPVASEAMPKVDACAGCHNQHELVNELAESGIGKVCSDCHMEKVDRKGREGRSHVFPGGHDVEMHRKATKLDVAVEGRQVVAKLWNVGAGHKIPSDARHRSYNLWISTFDEKGNPRDVNQQMVNGEARLYYRDQFKPSTQVAWKSSLVATWPLPEDLKAGRAVVRLTYALNPEELAAGKVAEVRTGEVQFK